MGANTSKKMDKWNKSSEKDVNRFIKSSLQWRVKLTKTIKDLATRDVDEKMYDTLRRILHLDRSRKVYLAVLDAAIVVQRATVNNFPDKKHLGSKASKLMDEILVDLDITEPSLLLMEYLYDLATLEPMEDEYFEKMNKRAVESLIVILRSPKSSVFDEVHCLGLLTRIAQENPLHRRRIRAVLDALMDSFSPKGYGERFPLFIDYFEALVRYLLFDGSRSAREIKFFIEEFENVNFQIYNWLRNLMTNESERKRKRTSTAAAAVNANHQKRRKVDSSSVVYFDSVKINEMIRSSAVCQLQAISELQCQIKRNAGQMGKMIMLRNLLRSMGGDSRIYT